MIEIWNDYWWGITILVLLIHLNIIDWEARGLRVFKKIEHLDALRKANEIDDDVERIRAKGKIEPIDNAYLDKKEAVANLNAIPWLLHIIIFLLVAIYMKLP